MEYTDTLAAKRDSDGGCRDKEIACSRTCLHELFDGRGKAHSLRSLIVFSGQRITDS